MKSLNALAALPRTTLLQALHSRGECFSLSACQTLLMLFKVCWNCLARDSCGGLRLGLHG